MLIGLGLAAYETVTAADDVYDDDDDDVEEGDEEGGFPGGGSTGSGSEVSLDDGSGEAAGVELRITEAASAALGAAMGDKGAAHEKRSTRIAAAEKRLRGAVLGAGQPLPGAETDQAPRPEVEGEGAPGHGADAAADGDVPSDAPSEPHPAAEATPGAWSGMD